LCALCVVVCAVTISTRRKVDTVWCGVWIMDVGHIPDSLLCHSLYRDTRVRERDSGGERNRDREDRERERGGDRGGAVSRPGLGSTRDRPRDR
jgi:hypothetical protein